MATYELETPVSEEDVRKLRVNDVLYISGTIFTARDAAHKRALEFNEEGKKLPIDPNGLAVFHCGPIVRKIADKWEVVAAGPTTSTRMEIFQDQFIKAFKVRIVIGKGGMGPRTANAMKTHGAVYSAFTGGTAVLAAKAIQEILDVAWFDLGMAEAVWIMKVKRFGPLIVAIDSTGSNLFEQVKAKAEQSREQIYSRLGVS